MAVDPLHSLSLDALRGFEAAARHLSFTAAADELHVTQSAVSKQVRLLEDALGKPLFTRGPRGLRLTGEGAQLHAGVRDGLGCLQAALQQVMQAGRPTVSLSVTPSFASLWLAPRLAAWRARHPGIDLRIDATEADAQLDREGIDLAVRLSSPERAAASWTLLAREQALLVASPDVAARVRAPADLLEVPLVVFRHPLERLPAMSWARWYESLGLQRPASQPLLQCSQYEHALKAAASGAGVAIGRAPLVSPMLASGELRHVLPPHRRDGLGYWLVRPESGASRPEVEAVAAWLAESLAGDDSG